MSAAYFATLNHGNLKAHSFEVYVRSFSAYAYSLVIVDTLFTFSMSDHHTKISHFDFLRARRQWHTEMQLY